MEIRNTTKRPLRISLPGGKRLHLGPLATGQVAPKAVDSPKLKELIDAGDIEVVSGKHSRGSGPSGSGGGMSSSQDGSGGGPARQTGDR